MAQKIKSEKITQQWYQQKRPYKSFDDYDRYLLKVTQKIADLLKEQPFPLPDFKLTNEQNNELASIITGYFEDFMSETNIWSSLREYHQNLYGTAVPVLLAPEDTYDSEYINAVDIQFLLWNFYARLYFGYAMTPQFEYFFLLSESVFNILDEEVNKQMATSFYDEYFTVNEHTTFQELYQKLHWFTMASYVTGFEYRYKLGQQFIEQQKISRDAEYLSMIHRFIQNDLIFRYPSQYSAFTIPVWFSRIINADATIKEKVASLIQHIGKYKFTRQENDLLYFTHLYSGREYPVASKSITGLDSAGLTPGNLYQASFVQWGKEWHLTSTLIYIQEKEDSEEITKYKMHGEDLLDYYDEKYQSQSAERNKKLKAAFEEVFADNLVFFDNGEALQEGIEKFLNVYNRNEHIGSKQSEKLPEDIRMKKDLVLYFRDEHGYEIAEKVNEFITLANQESVDEEQKQFMVKFTLFSNVSSQLIMTLQERYELKNLDSAFNAIFEVKRELPFFLRFYKSYDFSH